MFTVAVPPALARPHARVPSPAGWARLFRPLRGLTQFEIRQWPGFDVGGEHDAVSVSIHSVIKGAVKLTSDMACHRKLCCTPKGGDDQQGRIDI